MDRLPPDQIAMMFLALGVLLAAARVLGEMARRFNQPAVLGEIVAGILLGPTVLGYIAPGAVAAMFPQTGPLAITMDGLTTLAITLFLLVAGMEVDLSTVWRQGKVAVCVGVGGLACSFVLGFTVAWFIPELLDREPGVDALVFALFFAIALSMTALPVIAKTLMDLDLYRSDFGMVVIAAAVLNDLLGWMIFAVILGMAGGLGTEGHGPTMHVGQTIGWTLAFAVGVLTIGRWLIHALLPWVQAHTAWPGGVLGFALSLALLGAAFTEWIGVHAIFGAFLVGVALGDSPHLREQTRATIDRFISFIFAPLFFASIGLKVNFAANFDVVLVLVVTGLACAGMVTGAGLGARWGGLTWPQAWAVGFGMNARGAMEIILGLLALQAGLIGERLFVALVVMALVTSILSGPVMQRLLRRKKARRFIDFLSSKTFIGPLEGRGRWQAIEELSNTAAEVAGLDKVAVNSAVVARERLQSTGLGNGVAVPHARLEGLAAPVLAVGFSQPGIDFDAPDGEPAKLIFLLLTPADDPEVQLEILSDMARSFQDPRLSEQAVKTEGYTEFLAWHKSGRPRVEEEAPPPEVPPPSATPPGVSPSRPEAQA